FKVKKLDFSKQLKQFILKPKKCEEFGKSFVLEILMSRASLSSRKKTLESPKSLQQYYEAMPKCLTSFFDGLVLTLQLKNHKIVKRKQEEHKKTVTELNKSEIVKTLHAEFVTDNCISKTTNAEIDHKKALQKLVNILSEAIECNEPEKHPLFEISNQLTPKGYEISDIIKQDILKVEKRIAKGRTKKDLVPLLLGKKAASSKKKQSMEDISS
ncbi:21116_t:CDS:2, partial [Dentiscutata erythropus]